MRFIKQSSLFCILLLSVSTIAAAQETYRGTIWHSPSGRSSDIYIRKDKDRNSLEPLREMMDTINAIEKYRNERERLEIERQKLNLLKEQNEIEKKRLEQEQKRAKETESQYDHNKSYGDSYSPPSGIQEHATSNPQTVPTPFKVYFRNGKELLCDYAWRDGGSIFLVIHGKRFALSYPDSEIEMTKSFR
jgi:TolA-binding protein